ncbi:MAG: CHAD domain-containing protein [Betaproteobacteria bacterium]|nr:CHAD domain-containing protein [Betaproteobacteria bacterium]
MTPESPPIELELKLRVPSGSVRRLSAHRLLKGAAGASKRRLHSVYFDTPKLELWRQGIALRLRRDGERWFQAVKGGGTALAGLHRRVEDEVEVAGPALDLSRIVHDELAGLFSSERLRARLKPVFVADFIRSSRLLEMDSGARVEASIDRGLIRSGSRAERVVELELELKSGPPRHLYEFALKLVRDLPLSVENRSKAERGYALCRGKGPKPVKARPASLSPAFSAGEAFKAVMQAGLAHLQANAHGMLAGGDLEYLHQMRVALRRLRSAFSVFEPFMPGVAVAPMVTELKWLASSLGPARDWDVFLTETLPPIEKEFGSHGELKAFSGRYGELRRKAGAKARRAVRSARYQRLMLSLAGWLESWSGHIELEPDQRAALGEPIGAFASKVLEQRYNRVRKRGRKFDQLSSRELHRLRIAVKKFRYATDFFAGIYEGGLVRVALRRLSDLQEILGAINDAATVTDLTAHGFDGAGGVDVAEAKGILLGWSRGRAETLKRELKSAWRSFRAAGRFWQ